MPYADFGEDVNFSTSRFTKLKSKGDKVKFRVIGAPFYDGKHFLKDEAGDWDIRPCVRINEGSECEFCEKFFKAHAKVKKQNIEGKEARKLTDPWSASVSFYFPIINRDTGKFEVFQTTKGVRDGIEAEIELGTKVLDRDLVVLRTEVPGSYYKLSVVDSADTKKLTKEEKAEAKKAKDTNLSEFVHGKEDEAGVSAEANTDIVDF